MPETLAQEFKTFLVEAKTEHGYGMPGATVNKRVGDSRELIWGRDGWKYADRWIGGNPYVGAEAVAYIDTAVWGMAYHGRILDAGFGQYELSGWMGEVLSRPQADLPIRGPHQYKMENGVYNLSYDGSLEDFEATEAINVGGRVVYAARFIGGLANSSAWPESRPWIEGKNAQA